MNNSVTKRCCKLNKIQASGLMSHMSQHTLSSVCGKKTLSSWVCNLHLGSSNTLNIGFNIGLPVKNKSSSAIITWQ